MHIISSSLLASSHLQSKELANMFYIIGLGLCDEKDITVRGLEVRVLLLLHADGNLNCSLRQ